MGEASSMKQTERIEMQTLYQRIEQKTDYSSADIERIWRLIKREMIYCFRNGKSVDLGEGFGYMQTSIFDPGKHSDCEKLPRYQVRFKTGKRLKDKLELKTMR